MLSLWDLVCIVLQKAHINSIKNSVFSNHKLCYLPRFLSQISDYTLNLSAPALDTRAYAALFPTTPTTLPVYSWTLSDSSPLPLSTWSHLRHHIWGPLPTSLHSLLRLLSFFPILCWWRDCIPPLGTTALWGFIQFTATSSALGQHSTALDSTAVTPSCSCCSVLGAHSAEGSCHCYCLPAVSV